MSSIKYFIELNFYPVLCSSPLQLQKIAEQSIIGFDALYNFLYWKIRTKISLIKKTQNPVNNVPLVTEWRYRIKRRDRHEMKKEGGFPPNVKTLLERVLLNVIYPETKCVTSFGRKQRVREDRIRRIAGC
jgi:hypothetical protein